MVRKEKQIPAKDYEEIRTFIFKVLKKSKVTRRNEVEAMLVFEALYNNLMVQGLDEDTALTVRVEKTFGETRIKIDFEGEPVSYSIDDLPHNVEGAVMNAYAEKIDHRYHTGHNHYTIMVKRNYSSGMIYSMVAFLVAFIVYIPIQLFMGPKAQHYLLEEIVFPTEMIFSNIIVMVGAPVTFFSLLNNMTDAYILAEKNSNMRRLHAKTLISSVNSIFLSLAWGFVFGKIIVGHLFFAGGLVKSEAINVPKILAELSPSSIVDPFQSISPFPLIILAVMSTYALCSAGKYFDAMKSVIKGCCVLFSKMLTVVMFALPVFSFLAMLDVLLDDGFADVGMILIMEIIIILSLSVLALYYAARLKHAGVGIRDFLKKLPPLIKENIIINSAIDAVPFNIRYCTTKYKMDRKQLEDSIPILAEMNLDGNCFVITLMTILLVETGAVHASWLNLLGIALLVLFLSLGAPSQPGSCVIGLMIILNYLGQYDYVCVAIYGEVLLGWLINLVNVVGDIVTVATEDENMKKISHKKTAEA